MIAYPLTCPLCGGALYPVALDAQSAPWICVICKHSWWVAELSANRQYRRQTEDFGLGGELELLRAAVESERALAHRRGTSCRSDQLALLPLAGLEYLNRLALDPAFILEVEAELARKQPHPA